LLPARCIGLLFAAALLSFHPLQYTACRQVDAAVTWCEAILDSSAGSSILTAVYPKQRSVDAGAHLII
jgi:hypothetical protein